MKITFHILTKINAIGKSPYNYKEMYTQRNMANKKETSKKKVTRSSSKPDIKSLINNVIYLCDNKKPGEIQAFMFKAGKKTSKQYSVMTEFENVNGHIVVYNNGIGPDLTLKNIRVAPASAREQFFKAAQESNLEFDSKNGVWNYTAEPKVNVAKNKTLFEPLDASEVVSNKTAKNPFEDENTYCFITLDEAKDEYTEIIGEVKQKKNKIVDLNAWAYTSEPEIVRAPSQIIVSSQYDAPLTKLYKFASACVSLLIKKEQKDAIKKPHSKETKEAIVRFMNRIINDAIKKKVYVVCWNKRYFVYPSYDECASLVPSALCEITRELEIVCPSGEVKFVFGDNVVIDKETYSKILEEAKSRKEKEFTKVIGDALNNARTQEDENENEQKQFTTVIAEKPGADNSPVSCNILHTRENGDEYYTPGMYESTEKASLSLYADASDDYIIINVKDDSIVFKLTDDAQSVLHSRHLNHAGKTSVFGPIRDAHKTFEYILNKLNEFGWKFDENDTTLHRNENCDLGHLLKDVIEMQIDMAKKHYGYRLIQPSLSYYK